MSSEEPPASQEIVATVFSAMREFGRLANQIPLEDYDYHLAFPAFRKSLRENSDVLLETINECCKLLPKRRRFELGEAERDTSGVVVLREEQRAAVMEAIDSFLENVDSTLDEMRGNRLHAGDQLSVDFSTPMAPGSGGLARGGDSHHHSASSSAPVLRPQLSFAVPVDNSPAPFVPHYADAQGQLHVGTAGTHPFEAEIKAFNVPAHQLMPGGETPFLPLNTCPLHYVETEEDLKKVCATLAAAPEIAVDLEHHDYYSYQGFTCLMQISTREEDFIIDCLKLRSAMHLLAPVFLNPAILKVLHGAREDVRWLQKDFGLYLINFFDTGLALQALHMPYSLAFAVDHFCQVKLNKAYQTADWRVRPLSTAMLHYARQDTHYLLYIYDRLKALLLNSEGRASVGNLLVHVYKESAQLSLMQYEKPVLDPENSYKAALDRSLGGLSPVQELVAKQLFNWRDAAAREADDSPAAVLYLSNILSVASKLPTSARDLLRCCSPVSVVLRQSVAELVAMVRAALRDVEGVDEDALGAAADGAGDASAGVSSSTAAADGGRGTQGRRPLGIYRPMTGTLPSISSYAHPAHEVLLGAPALAGDANTTSAVVCRDVEPSAWFRVMQAQSRALARRARPAVPLPGVEVWELIQEARANKAAPPQPTTAPQDQENEEDSNDTDGEEREDEHDDDDEEEEGQQENTAEEEAEGKNGDDAGEDAFPSYIAVEKNTAPLPKAFSLRQQFGTGAKNRKKAKTAQSKADGRGRGGAGGRGERGGGGVSGRKKK